jgi:hypothetical protein
VRDWFTGLVSTPGARTGWLTSLAELFPGSSVAGGDVSVPISGGPVSVQVGFRSATGSGGHPQVTPRIGVQFTTDVAGGVRLGGRVAADLFTIDVGTGTLTPLPYADVAVTARGSGSGDAGKLLNTGPVDIGELRVGLSIRDGAPRALLELHDVDVDGSHQDVLDLSSPQAVGAAAGQLAGNLLRTALNGLGDAGDHLEALLGLTAPAGGTEIDGAALLADPLGALAAWWRDLTAPPATGAVEVLGHLRSLLSGDAQVTQLVTGSGTEADPWSIPIVSRLALTAWRAGDRLVVAPVFSLRVDDLAGGCTVVLTTIRLQVASFDLVARTADFLGSVEIAARLRARGGTEARLALGPVAVVADFIGLRAGWSPTAGFAVDLLTPGLAVETVDGRVPLALPTIDVSGNLTVPDAAWESVENLLGVLAASSPFGWFNEVVETLGWGLTGPSERPRLSLRALAADPAAALTAWLQGLVANGELVGSLTATLARLMGGSTAGLAGRFSGRGTPDDPWLAGLGASADTPALAVWLRPRRPRPRAVAHDRRAAAVAARDAGHPRRRPGAGAAPRSSGRTGDGRARRRTGRDRRRDRRSCRSLGRHRRARRSAARCDHPTAPGPRPRGRRDPAARD